MTEAPNPLFKRDAAQKHVAPHFTLNGHPLLGITTVHFGHLSD